ncbi:hypothetical protein ACFX5D_16190 [Flavobacterium sp. LB3P45]|uniref:Uncharacterized protein n=1 Tax=Flavobacterium fructosi TaxID=3230416 RepID=A0ABW6HR04_9FLAO
MGKRNLEKLSLIYDKRQKDFVVKYPLRCDGALILNHLVSDVLKHKVIKEYPNQFDVFNLKDELELRGYDLSTLKFSIELKSIEETEK